MGKIADILQARGELDEALRIRREEELPVYERLGDVRSEAVTQGQDRRHPAGAGRAGRGAAHPARGRAAGLRAAGRRAVAGGHHGQDRRHPAGAGRAGRGAAHPARGRAAGLRAAGRRAVAGGDAWARSPTSCRRGASWTRRCASGARKSCRSTSGWATCGRGGDQGKIADILQAAGRAGRGAAHPARGRAAGLRAAGRRAVGAVTMGKIADILQARGELDEALRIRREEAAARLRAAGRRAVGGRHAWARSPTSCRRGASSTRRCASGARNELPVYERLGDVRSVAVTHGQDRRHPAGAGRARRGAAHPARGRTARLRAAGRRAVERPSPWARSPTSCSAGRARRGAAHPARGTNCPSTSGWATCGRGPSPWARSPTSCRQRGEIDEALRILIRGAPAGGSRETRDIDIIATYASPARRLRLSRGGLEHGEAQTILDELKESFSFHETPAR